MYSSAFEWLSDRKSKYLRQYLVFSLFRKVMTQWLSASLLNLFHYLSVKDTEAYSASVNPAYTRENVHTNTTINHVMLYCILHIVGHIRILSFIVLYST